MAGYFVSQSDTILVGNPWFVHTILTKILSRSLTDVCVGDGTKCAIFVNLSTITHIWVYLFNSSNLFIQSIQIDDYGR